MGKKEKLKLQRKEERREMEIVNTEKKKKTKIFFVLFLLLIVAAYEANIAINNKKGENMQNNGEANLSGSEAGKGEEDEVENRKVVMETAHGSITLELYAKDAPKTVENFIKLAKEGFYDGIRFHRVIADFMVQGGDPNSKGTAGVDFVYDYKDNPNNLPVAGTGGPGYAFADEINPWSLGLSDDKIKSLESEGYKYRTDLDSHKNVVGAISMANSGPDTNGSQFFIITEQDQPHLDGKHTVFGKVTEGMEVVRGIAQGDEIIKVTVVEGENS